MAGPVQAAIDSKLRARLEPSELQVKNVSAAHTDEGLGRGESHFAVLVVSEKFEGVSVLNRHRLVNGALAEELAVGGPVHALAIEAKTPAQWAKLQQWKQQTPVEPTGWVAPTIGPDDVKHFHEQGFLVLRQAFSPARVAGMLAAVRTMLDEALDTEQPEQPGKAPAWPTLQWIDRSQRFPNRIAHMLAPPLFQPEFAPFLEELAPHLETLLSAPPRHGLFGMLSSGCGVPYENEWHHDQGIPFSLARARATMGHQVQINAPLLRTDRYLQIVPGSHCRLETVAELAAARRAPDNPRAAGELVPAMSGWVTLELEPGDLAMYNPNLWHRGYNPSGEARWTMHCSWIDASLPLPGRSEEDHEGWLNQTAALRTTGHIERLGTAGQAFVRHYLRDIERGFTGFAQLDWEQAAEPAALAASELRSQGYTVLKGHASLAWLRRCAATFAPIFAADYNQTATNRGPFRHYVDLPPVRPFIELLDDELIMAVASATLGGPDLHLDELGSDTPLVGSVYQDVHSDMGSMEEDVARQTEPPWILAVNIPLVEIGPDNGPFEIAARTQNVAFKEGKNAEQLDSLEMVPLTMQLGDVLLRDPRCLHRTGEMRPMLMWALCLPAGRTQHETISELALRRFGVSVEDLDGVGATARHALRLIPLKHARGKL
jgi:stress-induced morphogen/ectoine hydroxylase-related dioxygenase (phytanoyl-CoA dioxygenase family)